MAAGFQASVQRYTIGCDNCKKHPIENGVAIKTPEGKYLDYCGECAQIFLTARHHPTNSSGVTVSVTSASICVSSTGDEIGAMFYDAAKDRDAQYKRVENLAVTLACEVARLQSTDSKRREGLMQALSAEERAAITDKVARASAQESDDAAEMFARQFIQHPLSGVEVFARQTARHRSVMTPQAWCGSCQSSQRPMDQDMQPEPEPDRPKTPTSNPLMGNWCGS